MRRVIDKPLSTLEGPACVHRVKVRTATRAKPALVNAVHAFYHGEDFGTEHPDHNITQHSSTGARYPSLRPHYMHFARLCQTYAIRVERGSRTVVRIETL